MIISEIQLEVLKGLVTYRFLTLSQMMRIGIKCSTKTTLRKHIGRILKRRKPLVNRIQYNTIARTGRVEDVYFITELGKKLLIEQCGWRLENYKCPNEPSLTNDYWHRIRTIDFHIQVRKRTNAADLELSDFKTYFEMTKVGRSFQAQTRIDIAEDKSIIPDAIFKIKKPERERTFLFEFHNQDDVRRIKQQIENHAIALTCLKTHATLNIPKHKFYYVLILFDKKEAMQRLMIQLGKEGHRYQKISRFFLLNYRAGMESNLLDGWTNVSGEPETIKI